MKPLLKRDNFVVHETFTENGEFGWEHFPLEIIQNMTYDLINAWHNIFYDMISWNDNGQDMIWHNIKTSSKLHFFYILLILNLGRVAPPPIHETNKEQILWHIVRCSHDTALNRPPKNPDGDPGDRKQTQVVHLSPTLPWPPTTPLPFLPATRGIWTNTVLSLIPNLLETDQQRLAHGVARIRLTDRRVPS